MKCLFASVFLQFSATRKKKSCISSLCYSLVAFISIKSKIGCRQCQQKLANHTHICVISMSNTETRCWENCKMYFWPKCTFETGKYVGYLLDTIKLSAKHLFNILHATAMKQVTGTGKFTKFEFMDISD